MSVWFGFSDAWQRPDTRWLYSSPCSAHQTTSDHPWSACTQRADGQRITLRSSFWSDPWARNRLLLGIFHALQISLRAVLVFCYAANKKLCQPALIWWYSFGDWLSLWLFSVRIPSNVTDFNSDKKRGKMMWHWHFDSDYWKHPKHGTSSRTFRNECRRALSFCDYLPKSVFLQPNRNARK